MINQYNGIAVEENMQIPFFFFCQIQGLDVEDSLLKSR